MNNFELYLLIKFHYPAPFDLSCVQYRCPLSSTDTLSAETEARRLILALKASQSIAAFKLYLEEKGGVSMVPSGQAKPAIDPNSFQIIEAKLMIPLDRVDWP